MCEDHFLALNGKYAAMTTGFQATDRALLRVSGGDAEKFLQDLVSNDVTSEGLVYAALLTPQGKYLADFFLHRDGDDFVLDVDQSLAAGLAQRLSMYKLRADVDIRPDDSPVWILMSGSDGFQDPRNSNLGRRVYGRKPAFDAIDTLAWEELRVAHVIPQSGAELIPNDSYILECGFERVSGVDFRKGCYVGQEVTARMKHKTELRKGISGVELGDGSVSVGTEIIRDGKSIGHLTSVAGSAGIAYLRLDRAGEGMTAGPTSVTLRAPG